MVLTRLRMESRPDVIPTTKIPSSGCGCGVKLELKVLGMAYGNVHAKYGCWVAHAVLQLVVNYVIHFYMAVKGAGQQPLACPVEAKCCSKSNNEKIPSPSHTTYSL